jgi:hypothetical protein
MSHPKSERRTNAPPGSPLLAGLTPEQARADTHGAGPLLLIAGPGARPTRSGGRWGGAGRWHAGARALALALLEPLAPATGSISAKPFSLRFESSVMRRGLALELPPRLLIMRRHEAGIG